MKAQNPQWLGTSDPYARLRRIEQLDLATDYREIAVLFYGDFQSVMLAKSFCGFMFTYGATRISAVLNSTGQSEHHIAKRVVDTTLLGSAVMMNGFATPVGAAASRRVNEMHKKYDIHTDDFIATACEETLISIELAEKFGWRPVTDKEREAVRLFYNDQARAFGSPKGLPATIELTQQFFSNYLDTQLSFQPHHKRLADVLIQWFRGQMPKPVRPFTSTFLFSTLDPRMARACGFEPPGKIALWISHALMRKIGRRDPVPDNTPSRLAALVASVYPNGWEMDKLGTHVKQSDAK